MSDVRVLVDKVLFDPKVQASVMLLKEKDGKRILPVWIGQSEALSIAMAMEDVSLTRPMTHDLMQSILKSLGASITFVRIHSLDEGTFYAILRLSMGDETVDIDSRPSDAVALAIRMKSPVYVSENVLSESINIDLGTFDSIDEDLLSELPDDVFGKYKM